MRNKISQLDNEIHKIIYFHLINKRGKRLSNCIKHYKILNSGWLIKLNKKIKLGFMFLRFLTIRELFKTVF